MENALLTRQSVVILFGPPGAGKGTQAEFLKERFGFHHVETSRIIERNLATHADDDIVEVDGARYAYGEERRKFASGELNTPDVVRFWLQEAVRTFHGEGKNLIFSGSPRTLPEAQALYPVFDELFGKSNCALAYLRVPEEVSMDRNSHRMICADCRFPHREGNFLSCRRCGGTLRFRGSLDKPEVIEVRLREFRERTLPVFLYTEAFGVATAEVNAHQPEEKVFDSLCEALGLPRPAEPLDS